MNLTEKKLGMTLEEFIKLPHLEQEQILKKLHLENSNNVKTKKIMHGSGSNAIFVSHEVGEKVMINNGMFIKVGANPYDEKYNIDKKIDNIFIKERKRKK